MSIRDGSQLRTDLYIGPTGTNALPQTTFGGWVKSEPTDNTIFISQTNGAGVRDRVLWRNLVNGAVRWVCNTRNNAIGDTAAVGGQFQFVAVCYDADTSRALVYVDGQTTENNTGIMGDGGPRFYIGTDPISPNAPLTGIVDNVFVMSECLSVARLDEIRTGGYRKIPTCATIFSQPSCDRACLAGTARFEVDAGGSGELTLRWQRESAPDSGIWINLNNGAVPGFGVVSGATAPELTIANVGHSARGNYRCVATNACATATTNAAELFVHIGPPGDMNCNGFVEIGDIGGFVQSLTNPQGYSDTYPDCDIFNADTNCDDFVTVADIGSFVQLLTD